MQRELRLVHRELRLLGRLFKVECPASSDEEGNDVPVGTASSSSIKVSYRDSEIIVHTGTHGHTRADGQIRRILIFPEEVIGGHRLLLCVLLF